MPRIDFAVVFDNGKIEIVNGGRPAALIAFADKFGHDEPRNYAEIAWLAHRASRATAPLEEWQETLADLDPRDRAVERARIALRDGIPFESVPELEQPDPLGEARAVRLAVELAYEWAVRLSETGGVFSLAQEEIAADARRALVKVLEVEATERAEVEAGLIQVVEPELEFKTSAGEPVDPTPATVGGIA